MKNSSAAMSAEIEKKKKVFFRRWEWYLVILVIFVNIVNAYLSPYYLNLTNLMDMTFNFMEKGFIVLIMAYIMISANIDISVASNIAMSSVVMSVLYQSGFNIWLAVLLGLCTGAAGGLLNGLIVTRFRLSSVVVTLGTYSLYRGISFLILGDTAVTKFPERFSYVGQGYILRSPVPFQLVVFVVLAALFSIILHKTTFGRYVYSIGTNEEACRYSGVKVDRIKVILFTLSGFLSAFSGVFLTSRIGVSRPSIALNYELEIITIVVLGGVSMYGGRGTMAGVILALFLVGMLRYGLSLKNVPANMILIIIGLILICSAIIPNVVYGLRRRSEFRKDI